MSKGSRVREVLEQMAKYIRHRSHVSPNNYDLYKKEGIDKVLSDLAEIVRGEKKDKNKFQKCIVGVSGSNCNMKSAIYNQAITDIAKLFEEQTELCKCEPHLEMPQEIRCSRCHKILPKDKEEVVTAYENRPK